MFKVIGIMVVVALVSLGVAWLVRSVTWKSPTPKKRTRRINEENSE